MLFFWFYSIQKKLFLYTRWYPEFSVLARDRITKLIFTITEKWADLPALLNCTLNYCKWMWVIACEYWKIKRKKSISPSPINDKNFSVFFFVIVVLTSDSWRSVWSISIQSISSQCRNIRSIVLKHGVINQLDFSFTLALFIHKFCDKQKNKKKIAEP